MCEWAKLSKAMSSSTLEAVSCDMNCVVMIIHLIHLIYLQIELDIAELKTLLAHNAHRETTKRLLNNELIRLEELKKGFSIHASGKQITSATQTHKMLYNYAWDQTDKFVKIYLNLTDLKGCSPSCDESAVDMTFPQENCVQIICCGTKFVLSRLYDKIIPSESNFKFTKSHLVLSLKKSKETRWSNIQATEAKSAFKNTKEDVLDDNADPSQALMKLMKKMYDEGDDEMKRSITKSWYEAQNKKSDIDMKP